MTDRPTILTNMAFWQSSVWTEATTSIYPIAKDSDPAFLPWWREAWELFKRRKHFDVVVTMGVRESIAYGLLCFLTASPSKQIFTEVFIDEAKPNSFAWRIKTAVQRIVARRAIGVLTNSTMEVASNAERFQIPRERLRFVPMHSNIPDITASLLEEGYILSAGRTLRDYASLLLAAKRVDRRFLIICGKDDLPDAELPDNVEILREIPREIYLQKLRRCTLVALPLLPTLRSTGQVVMLEAMACGKPVVTTRSPGTVDIIRDGENGRLVPERDPLELAAVINHLLAHEDETALLAKRAREELSNLYSFDVHARAKLAAIAELWNLRAAN